ncbi:hypothetical protein E2C01_004802 [Portunus trituberculatus]|uniref:Uncharacterized protein n=1 Tax=Portunus trituberculatus TaxID=210409 RepID=A0A5B7CXE9_PORTR|nr:hypothetical protein [Portunus trituberculatus]
MNRSVCVKAGSLTATPSAEAAARGGEKLFRASCDSILLSDGGDSCSIHSKGRLHSSRKNVCAVNTSSVGRRQSKPGRNKTLCSLLLRHRHSWTQIHGADPFTQWSSSAIYSPPPRDPSHVWPGWPNHCGAVLGILVCAKVTDVAVGKSKEKVCQGDERRKIIKIRWVPFFPPSLHTSKSRPPETHVAMQPLSSQEACTGTPRCCTGLTATVSSGLLQTSCFPAVTVIFRVTAQSREGPHIKYRDVFGIKE